MKNFFINVTKSLVTDEGIFSLGNYIEFKYHDVKYVGKISEIDERYERIIVDLLDCKITRSVFEIKDIEDINFVIFD